MRILRSLLLIPLAFVSCSSEENHSSPSVQNDVEVEKSYSVAFSPIISAEIDSTEHFRGLNVFNGIAYISGSNGNILTYNFSNNVFSKIFNIEGRHFRDVDVTPEGNVIALAIYQPAEIWMKTNHDSAFSLAYQNSDTLAFLDGVDFWDSEHGLAFGDPLDGYPLVLETSNGGKDWTRINQEAFPDNMENLAGFAASGTSISCFKSNSAIIGLGGTTAKFLQTDNAGQSWSIIDAPYHEQENGSGVYSLTFKDDKNGVAVGGHWENTTCDSSKLYTIDGGLTWNLASGNQEYRSCVTHFKDEIYLATGSNGTDISYDSGISWTKISDEGFNAIVIQPNGQGIAVSNRGKISTLELIKNE